MYWGLLMPCLSQKPRIQNSGANMVIEPEYLLKIYVTLSVKDSMNLKNFGYNMVAKTA